MPIDKFKSFLLTLTGNRAFYLEHFINNNQTINDLVKINDPTDQKI